jgi:hypothetical protein
LGTAAAIPHSVVKERATVSPGFGTANPAGVTVPPGG